MLIRWLKKLHKKIIHHEGAINEWDDENPDYIVENVLKQRFVKVFVKKN